VDTSLFPANNYAEVTETVTTSAGQETVVYHLYHHITYVANPVDANYESLDVGIPFKIN
jgi:hypothetical protein